MITTRATQVSQQVHDQLGAQRQRLLSLPGRDPSVRRAVGLLTEARAALRDAGAAHLAVTNGGRP
jgi:uncharacterized membrane protein YdfJ with MMPL/SSD domain